MSDKTDPRSAVLAGLFSDVAWDEMGAREGVSVDEGLAGLDLADHAAGVVRVDTRDEALVERIAKVMYAHPGGEFPAWRLVSNDIKDLYRAEARAVLAALRESA